MTQLTPEQIAEAKERLRRYAEKTYQYKAWRGEAPEGEATLTRDILAVVCSAPNADGAVAWRSPIVGGGWGYTGRRIYKSAQPLFTHPDPAVAVLTSALEKIAAPFSGCDHYSQAQRFEAVQRIARAALTHKDGGR